MTTLTLAWPAKDLSPNSRCHWSRKSKAAKLARAAAWAVTKQQRAVAPADGPVALTLTFCAPDKRRRDTDNMLAAMKSSLDGIADALGVDDNRFQLTMRRGEVVKGGAVVVDL